MALLLKALLGAVVVLVIAALSKSRNYYIAGLVPLFPTFSLIAHYIVGTTRPPADLRATILFGMWSLVPYFTYLLVLYLLMDRMRLGPALVFASLAWIAVAAVLVLAWRARHA
ncbi:MAG TPA: GlpM family protein [Longimicrobium sp.]|nr:GlpM family protein [Longimicrobium sp.]